MDHLLFDALKISPIPMETANKATATGWMLEIEKILNSILENSDKHYVDLAIEVKKCLINTKSEIEKLESDLKNYNVSKEYADVIFNHLQKKLKDELLNLLGSSLNYVTFGLTDDGYFVAYVPDNLSSIEFTTDLNPDSENYGKLQINY